MRFVRTWSNSERWEWFAAGDPEVAPKMAPASQAENSAQRLFFEVGLALFVPLAVAALIEVILGA